MAKEFGRVSDSEEDVASEVETADAMTPDVPGGDVPGGQPPVRTERGTRPGGGDGGGRRSKGASSSAGFLARTSQFMRDTRAEMRRVSWPTAKDVQNTTVITLVAVVFFALYLFAVDRVWAFLLLQLNHLLNWMTGSA